MTVRRFVDTNILLYAFDRDASAKQAVALRLWQSWLQEPGETALSVQVLQELHVNLTRKGRSQAEAYAIVRDFYGLPLVENTLELFDAALAAQERWQLSLWDAMILAAAQASGAQELVTEDFNSGQDYGGVVARNPFARA
jgi:predicted nucleic acid-binding protein